MSVLLSPQDARALIWNALTGSGTAPENAGYFTDATLLSRNRQHWLPQPHTTSLRTTSPISGQAHIRHPQGVGWHSSPLVNY